MERRNVFKYVLGGLAGLVAAKPVTAAVREMKPGAFVDAKVCFGQFDLPGTIHYPVRGPQPDCQYVETEFDNGRKIRTRMGNPVSGDLLCEWESSYSVREDFDLPMSVTTTEYAVAECYAFMLLRKEKKLVGWMLDYEVDVKNDRNNTVHNFYYATELNEIRVKELKEEAKSRGYRNICSYAVYKEVI